MENFKTSHFEGTQGSDSFSAKTRAYRTRTCISKINTYFCDNTYRIVRSQDTNNHDNASFGPIENLKAGGGFKSFDYWNIYSFDLIEKLVKSCASEAEVIWFDDINPENRQRPKADVFTCNIYQ